MRRPTKLSQTSRDGLLIAASWLTLVLGFGLGLKPLTTAFFVGAAPLAAFAFAGHFVGRGAAVAGLILTLGVGFLKIGVGFSMTDCMILGVLAGGALVGGLIAEGMTATKLPAMPSSGSPAPGAWMTVIVESGDRPTSPAFLGREASPHFNRLGSRQGVESGRSRTGPSA